MDGYEYDNESEGMRAALERAREQAPEGDGLAELEQRLKDSWGDDSSGRPDDAPPVAADAPQDESPVPAGAPPPTPPPEEPWARMKYELEQNATRKPAADPLAEKMKAAGWASKESAASGPPDWQKLQEQLQAAEHGAETQRTIGAMLHAAAPGFQAPANAGAGDVAAAKAPLEVEQQRQEAAARQRQADAALLGQHREMTRTDPGSPESQRARAALRPVFEMAGKVPEGFDGWSAADVEAHAKTLTPIATGANAERIAKEKAAAAEAAKETAAGAKKEAADKTAAEETGSLEQERALLLADPRAKKLGLTPEMISKLDRKGMAGVQHQLESIPKEKPAGAPAKPVHSVADISDPADRAKVQAIIDGRADLTSAGLKDRGRIAGLVMQADPNYDQTRYGAYKSVVGHQATDKEIVAAEVARDHFKHARTNLPTGNFEPQMLNRLRRAILTGTGSAEMTPFEVDVKVAADEYAKALGNSAQSGREEIEHLFSSAQSPEQLTHALAEAESLLDSKLHAWKSQREKVAPKSHDASVKSWKNTKTGKTTKGTVEQLKASKNPDDWEEVPGG